MRLLNSIPDTPFPTWRKGEEKRQRILEFVERHPRATIDEIAKAIDLSPCQVKRHRSKLKSQGLWKGLASAIFLFSSVYYAASSEFQREHIKYSTLIEDLQFHIETTVKEITWRYS